MQAVSRARSVSLLMGVLCPPFTRLRKKKLGRGCDSAQFPNHTRNQPHKMARLLFVDEHGEVADDVYGKLLRDYRIVKAKKEMQLKNRKKHRK